MVIGKIFENMVNVEFSHFQRPTRFALIREEKSSEIGILVTSTHVFLICPYRVLAEDVCVVREPTFNSRQTSLVESEQIELSSAYNIQQDLHLILHKKDFVSKFQNRFIMEVNIHDKIMLYCLM